MRTFSAILFILGIPWACFAWIAIFGGPAAMVEELVAGRWMSVLGLIVFWPLFAAHVVLGYFVWIRWFSITRGTGVASKRFWLIASAHHFGWVVWGVVCYLQGDSFPPLMFGYAFVVLIGCLVAAVVAHVKSPATPVRT